MGVGGRSHAPPPIQGSPRNSRGFGWCERQFRRREPSEPKLMSTAAIETSPKSKRGATKASGQLKSGLPPKSAPIGKPAKIDIPQSEGRATKQELVLTLLRRSSGASIEEIMQATTWQGHSVRGFLAGTAKEPLNSTLGSYRQFLVTAGAVRRRRFRADGRAALR